eukprot:CAMPEP_0194192946 /NCGR_PEP_ID=MMETSP0154-20130528/72769_1 /TAXON_ID=1049557 /ORGANISM="Thalassiothrix antarctica, Strain L6-D1" /LENGTH=413 /DNA_ID=CAMNT_0038916817 /DNA_START=83 /DNA_END=1324 /DNA_ORIENTATION=+
MSNICNNHHNNSHDLNFSNFPPIIDLANPDTEGVVKEIANACSEFGFFQVISHEIPLDLLKEYSRQCRLYFGLPHDVKIQWKRNEGNSRGFFDDELTKQRRDWKEALDFGVPGTRDWSVDDDHSSNQCLDGWNQLPSEEVLPNFRPTVTRYFDECSRLSDHIAIIMAKGIGQAETTPFIQDLRENHSSYLRVNYYPICDDAVAEEEKKDREHDTGKPLGISPHYDAGFLTVLLQDDDCHSLQVWTKDEQWITVSPTPGALTINTGDMAQVWSNNRYKAPLHRVLTNKDKVRYSAPFFYNPSYRAKVGPLLLRNSDNNNKEEKPLYHPVLWGYFRAVRFAGDLTNLGVEIQIDHFLIQEENNDSKKTKKSSHHHLQRQEIFSKEADFSLPFSVEKYQSLLLSSFDNVNDNENEN